MSHTPGEWFYYDKAIQVTDGDNDTYIAWIQYPFTEEGRANAALISAAPDLLAMCEELQGNTQVGWLDPEILERLDSAIKKAKGEAV